MKHTLLLLMLFPAMSFCQNTSKDALGNQQSTTQTSGKSNEITLDELRRDRKGLPVYLFNGTGSGSIIGFMNNGSFRKVRPEEYEELTVQQYAKDLLENEESFKTWLRIQYGGYCYAVR